MATTIQISNDLLTELKNRKMYDNETYEDIIWDLFEDSMELSDETLRHIEASKKDLAEGKTITLSELKKKLGH